MGMRAGLGRGLWNRRGLLTGAAAAIGAGLTKLGTSERALASHDTNIAYDSQTVVHVDVLNTTAGSTRIRPTVSAIPAFPALAGLHHGSDVMSRPDGVQGQTAYTIFNAAGVAGACTSGDKGIGVSGTTSGAAGTGVFGYAGSITPNDTLPSGVGVAGKGDSFGVWGLGRAASGIGTYGESGSNAGVYGKSQSNAGVYGESPIVAVAGTSGSGIGVQGTSTSNAGLYGQSTNNAAVYGTSSYAGVYGTSPTVGVWGVTTSGTALFGQANGPGGFAGQFVGNVFINGSLTVTGSAPKSAAVSHPDGSLRRMYCQEAPEPWFEDFGRDKLGPNGQAAVKLDPDFAAVVKTDDYLVFLTEVGDAGGLFVTNQTAARFTIQSGRRPPGAARSIIASSPGARICCPVGWSAWTLRNTSTSVRRPGRST